MKIFKVKQHLYNNPIQDVFGEVIRALNAAEIKVPKGEVAITAGSRGIANIPLIIKAAGECLRDKGARPFIVPCMGSHNGATAHGQRAMLETLGISEEAVGMEIRASMDVAKLGSVRSGDVYMDKFCFEAAGVLVINRVKLHTAFSGPVQSGLMKMMVVGMGKIKSAQTFHSTVPSKMADMLLEMGGMVLKSGKIIGGLSILEDGYDQTAELHAIHPKQIPDREPQLLKKHRQYFPQLPIDDINVLIVDEIGKNYSGTGMDTNVIGYRGIKGHEDLLRPNINIIAALALSNKTQGNGTGVGLADFITEQLRETINKEKTFINVYTSGFMQRAKIPVTFPDDETLMRRIQERYGLSRWMFIPNTLHLGHLFVSEDMRQEIEAHPKCEIVSESRNLTFQNGRHQLDFT